MKYRPSIFVGLILQLILACEKEVDIEEQLKFSPKIVLDAENEADSLITLHLSQSANTTSEVFKNNLKGEVTVLFKQNEEVIYVNDLTIANGQINLPYKAVGGNLYEVQLRMEGLPTIAAKDTVPFYKPDFSIVNFEKMLDYYQLKVSLDDIGGQQFYLLKIKAIGIEKVGLDSFQTEKLITFESKDKVLLSSLRNWIQPGYFGVFDDAFLTGGMNAFRLQIPEDSLYTATFNPKILNIEISTISRATYTYYINLLENSRIYGGPLSNVKADYGNVDQGLGLFGFKNSQVIQIPIE